MATPYEKDALTDQTIGFAIEVHRHLGPGLLESAYEECLCFELKQNRIAFQRQVPLPVVYKSVRLDCGYRIDLVVENRLIMELKATERLLPIHEAQVIYLYAVERPAHGSPAELQHASAEGWHKEAHAMRRIDLSLSRCLVVKFFVGEDTTNG